MRNKIIDDIDWHQWEKLDGYYMKLPDVLSVKIDDIIEDAEKVEYIETLLILQKIINSFTEEEIIEKTNGTS